MTADTKFVLVLRADATLADLANMMRLATLCTHFRALWEAAAELTMDPAAVHARAEAIARDLSARGLATGEPLSMLAYVRAFGERRAPAALFAVAYDRCVRAADGDHLYTAGELLALLAPTCVAVPTSAIADVVPEELRGVFWGGSWAHDAAWMAKYGAHAYVPPPNDAAPTTDASAKKVVAGKDVPATKAVAAKAAEPREIKQLDLPVGGEKFAFDWSAVKSDLHRARMRNVEPTDKTLLRKLWRLYAGCEASMVLMRQPDRDPLSAHELAFAAGRMIEELEESLAEFYGTYAIEE